MVKFANRRCARAARDRCRSGRANEQLYPDYCAR